MAYRANKNVDRGPIVNIYDTNECHGNARYLATWLRKSNRLA